MSNGLGVVLIGRNEGARLVRALVSLQAALGTELRDVVYVDSASTDDSVQEARARGAQVVALDMSKPFSAARARNEGWRTLLASRPEVSHVHFFDGDCEVMQDYLRDAYALALGDPTIGAVCGYRREKFPEHTWLNQVCDVEWRLGSVGEIGDFGGDVLLSVQALQASGGYRDDVIAGEEPELALRLRRLGFRLLRICKTSSLHDADMRTVHQWWKRQLRAGHAFAQVTDMHPQGPFSGALKRALIWGAALPTAAVALAPLTLGASLGLAAAYPLQSARIARRKHLEGYTVRESVAWGVNCALGKIPEALGALKYYRDQAFAAAPTIIEYK